jgi:hypothetical protein
VCDSVHRDKRLQIGHSVPDASFNANEWRSTPLMSPTSQRRDGHAKQPPGFAFTHNKGSF